MKLTSNAGHSAKAGGAAHGVLHEHDIALDINAAFIAECKARGVSCANSTSEAATAKGVLGEQVRKANASGADIGVSHHLNSTPGGTGIEVWYNAGSAKGEAIAKKVSAAIAKYYGLRDRVAKPDTADRLGSLCWVSNTHMPAILIEWGFIDSDKDMALILHNIKGGVGAALTALGIEKKPATKPKAKPKPKPKTATKQNPVYVVHTTFGRLNIRKHASVESEIVARLKRGTHVEVVSVHGDFYEVKCGAVHGYAAKKYLKKA